ncbi:MAG TPA: long-chain fatty acid--CoA ligase [Flavobacteriales bacterium]|nr:long-chain fatty acid--CoA ligase [Flavobacteriales bacterium]HRE75657.1 long-chain fatty acid--CoA ligase [Flavobacteriales bacterium]HRE96670.1 long-chain fatty acid--CoA ligase [Flavobacteriales bacterium]HRJ36038.1 long-chain fatty acid--CoA ligase [Flavobacteriales bacterium]
MDHVKRLFDIPRHQLKSYPKDDMLTSKVNGKWVPWSTAKAIEHAEWFSKGLLELGISKGDKIAMISNNRPEWNIADMGILQIGAVDVPVYPTASEKDYEFIFNDAEVKICLVSGKELYDKVMLIRDKVPSMKEIYSFDPIEGVKSWNEILEKGKSASSNREAELKSTMESISEDDLATLIYTSGTTGVPKGVMLTHKNLVCNAIACISRLPVDSKGRSLSFLPICHVYERMIHYLYMITGVSIYFAESIDTVGDNLKEVKPQVFVAVPRLLEKVYDKIIAKGTDLSGIKKKLFFWAVDLGMQYEPGNRNNWWYRFRLKIARKLIFSKWQEALGGNVLAVASGGAALQPRLARIFLAAGIPVMEGYGLTETSPVIAVNCEKNDGVRIGTVGRVLDNVEVMIAQDGEILVKGPSVMKGYYKRPDATAETIDADGWLHTGDIGELVEGQFIRITDRKKEIFKTSGGKYIAPQPMENKFKESRFVEQVMIIGEGQKFPAALIVPAFVVVKEWGARHGHHFSSNEEMANSPVVKARIMQDIEEFNKDFGNWEQVKKIALLPQEFTILSGEMTPTLKLKRKFILEKYKDVVNGIYAE